MRKDLIIALCFASFGTLASMRPAFAEKKQVCNTTWFAGQTTHKMAKCKTIGGCTTTYPVAGLSANTKCYWVEDQPGAVSDSAGTKPNTATNPINHNSQRRSEVAQPALTARHQQRKRIRSLECAKLSSSSSALPASVLSPACSRRCRLLSRRKYRLQRAYTRRRNLCVNVS